MDHPSRLGGTGRAQQRSYTIDFPAYADRRGRLTIIESDPHLPFDIKRIYYLTDFSQGAVRGSHAHRKLQQVMVAVSGSFDVCLSDGREEWVQRLDRSDKGLYIGTYLWHEIRNCSADAVCLMLASMPYDENDYIRDYDEFCGLVKGVK